MEYSYNSKEQDKKKQQEEEPGFFKEFFSFTKDGKIKSLDLMWCLVVGLGILFLYFAVQHFFTLFAEEQFTGLSRTVMNILDVGVPTLLCTAICCALFALLKNKKIIPGAFVVQLIMELFVLIAALFMFSSEQRASLLPVMFYMFIIPTVVGACGVALTAYIYYKHHRG